MTAAYRSQSRASTTTSTSGYTATEPSGAAENDILLWQTICASATSPTTPSGWTLLNSWTGGSSMRADLYYIRRGASAPSLTITHGADGHTVEHNITAWSSADTSGSPWDVEQYGALTGSNQIDPPSATTTVDDTLVLAVAFTWGGWLSGGATPPSGYTLAGSAPQSGLTAVSYKAVTSAGTENPGTYGFSSFEETGAATIALGPAVAAGSLVFGPTGLSAAILVR